jgi:TonB-dependent receptor
MIAKRFLMSVSSCAIALAGAGVAYPAYAQDAQNAQDVPTGEEGDAGAYDDIVVTARRKALNDAIEIKRNADTIVDSVVADQAGKLPDTSITEVLQRVPGIALSRFAVGKGNPSFQIEGTGISVRGLPYNSSTLNGRQVFSANGASAISWGDVTPELMSGVDVYKGSLANLIEGGASLVDLRTRLPFDYSKPEFDLTIGGSYGDMAKKFSPSVSALYTKSWNTGIGEIGILYDFAFSRFDAQSSDLKMRPALPMMWALSLMDIIGATASSGATVTAHTRRCNGSRIQIWFLPTRYSTPSIMWIVWAPARASACRRPRRPSISRSTQSLTKMVR